MRIWDRYVSVEEREIYREAGFGQAMGMKDRPAVMVVDINWDFVGDRPEPVRESIKRWRLSCGDVGWAAMEKLVPVLAAARGKGIPVLYSTGGVTRPVAAKGATKSRARGPESPVPGYDPNAIADPIKPLPHEIVIAKAKASAFAGTPLLQYLVSMGVNQLLVCGTTTSGCVRATVLDAFSAGFHVAVIEDCTFDRGEAAHAVNLFDMHQKYADVMPAAEILQYLGKLPAGIFPDWPVVTMAAR